MAERSPYLDKHFFRLAPEIWLHVKVGAPQIHYARAMALYYFNIYNDDVTLDEEGADLADDHAAHAYAIKAARSLAADTASRGHLALGHRIEVVDADQKPIATVTFGEAVEVR